MAEPSRRADRSAEPADQKPNDPQFGETVEALDPQEAAYRALHGERDALERALALAQHRQRFGDDVEAARASEASLLRDLDRILTMIRAAESRRSQPQARRWQSGSAATPRRGVRRRGGGRAPSDADAEAVRPAHR